MKALLLLLACLVLSPAKADARSYAAEELEAILAPVALQPDDVLWKILEASTTPNDVIDAVAGRPARTPAVAALAPYPELLARMAESPQWLMDLGRAYIGQRNDVLAAVQALRQRAQVNGHLDSDPTRLVQRHGHAIAVLPAVPFYYSVRYYNPVVVYGATWHPRHPHVHWRPSTDVERRNGPPSPAARMQHEQAARFREHHHIPESRREPIVRPWGQSQRFHHGEPRREFRR